MCNRFQLAISFPEFQDELEQLVPPFPRSARLRTPEAAWEGSYNVKPTQDIPVLRHVDGALVIERLHWGWRPPRRADAGRSSGPKKPDEYFNARGETVERFAGAYNSGQTCLVISTGIWEWGPDKHPRCIQRTDGRPFCFAGLYADTTTKQGVATTGCVIITTTPNAVLAPIHNRMPVILPPEAWETWLTAPRRDLLQPAPDGLLRAWTVERFGIQADGAELLRPLGARQPTLWDTGTVLGAQ